MTNQNQFLELIHGIVRSIGTLEIPIISVFTFTEKENSRFKSPQCPIGISCFQLSLSLIKYNNQRKK